MPEVRLLARCTRPACEGAAALDPVAAYGGRRWWPADGAVSDRFRCRCGARTARLTYVAAGAVGPVAGVFLFA